MKKFYFLLVFICSNLLCFSHEDSLTIKGELNGQGNGRLSLSFMNDGGKPEAYATTAKNDKFSFKIKKQASVVVARFDTYMKRGLSKTIGGKNYGNPAPALDLFIYQSDLEITGSAVYIQVAKVKGDKENDQFAQYKNAVAATEKERWDLSKAGFLLDAVKDSIEYQKLTVRNTAISKKHIALQKKYLLDNPSSFGSIFLLSRMEPLYTADGYKNIFDGLRDDYKHTALAQGMKKRIEYLSPTAVGKPAIHFIRNDKDGNEVNLSEYKGKIVLLDFWGSWCGPCRASHPHLKELYSKYKDKGFEIIAIAQEKAKTAEEQKENWRNAIEKDGINWVHILNNDGKEKQDIVKDYRVTAFPTKILVDEEGSILLRITAGATDDIDKMLEKKLGK